MSILINLLPDIRLAKIRERRRRQLASGLAVSLWVVCGGVLVLMFVYYASLKVEISSHSTSINRKEGQLQNVSGLTDALTAEQHLSSLSLLYGQRVYMTKFFQAYQSATPNDVTIGSLTIDSNNNLAVQGTAASYAEVAKLARAVSDANVTVGPNAAASNMPYFSNVNVTNVATGTNGITFSLNAIVGAGAESAN
jgi:hypothetical protein